MKHEGSIISGDEPYQTLTLSASGPSYKVRLRDFDPVEMVTGSTLTVSFTEYVAADASGSTYAQRWGIT